ncbi:MAG: S8 family serine peptidase, partial [Acidimicrobiales bacterium]
MALAALVPFPEPPPGADPYDYTQLHITNGSCDGVAPGQRVPPGSDLPASFDCRDTHKLSDYAAVPGDPDYDPLVALNPQELHGVRGSATNRAWEITTGRPDVVIAVLDSGIRWDEDRPNLVDKFFLNTGELPPPPGGEYDANRDGRVSVSDYATDVRAVDDPDDDNDLLDPGDLIRAFSDGVDDDGNGYVDDISGWDFFEGDNDANDDVDYGHGTGESEDSAGEIGIDINPQCPNCTLLEMRVGDSFIADANHFAEATVYAVDNGASVIQSALGTLNHTGFARAAVDYAWERGVTFIASAADEAAGHHNMPSALPHAVVVNSVTPAFVFEDVVPVQLPRTWLAFNGCTNYGGYIWSTVASTSCSSDAVGQAAGIAGLLYSAARNSVDLGVIEPDDSGLHPLSASEARQLFRLASDDVDFSTPALSGGVGLPNNFVTTLPLSQRYVTTAGWDQISGWGRLSANELVRLVAAGRVPPEADILEPQWWEPLPETGTVDVVARVDAPRAETGSYTWEVQWTPGVQPPRWPLSDNWRVAATGSASGPVDGVLATLDLASLRAAIRSAPPVYLPTDDPTSPDLPERDAVRVRVVVHADGDTTTPWRTAIDQRQVFVQPRPDSLAGWPVYLGADGAGSATFADLHGDGTDELVIADGNGLVHAYQADGSEAAGWPVRSDPLPLPGRWDAYGAFLGGAPAVADLDGDGLPEVAAGDMEGRLYVWSHDGQRRAGFPVGPDPGFSAESACQEVTGPDCDDDGEVDARDELNTVDHAWVAPPSVGDLDPAHPGLELIAGSNDGHVYAFHADGTPVAGWPVLLRDPAKVAAVDPVTHRVSYVEGANAHPGRKIITTPSLGDVDGDGDMEVAVTVNESYEEPPNTTDLLPQLVDLLETPGNTRVYLLHHDGAAHPATSAQDTTPHPHDQAYVAGWPVRVAMALLDVLPYVGEGSNGSPVLGDVDGDGTMEILVASVASPPYVFRADGAPFLGTDGSGRARTMQSTVPGLGALATDLPSVAALGGGVVGRIGGSDQPLSFAMGSAGLRRLLDVLLPEQQLLAEDHIGVWDPRTGLYQPGFPARMNDLQFFNTPAIADVTGDGAAEVLQGSALYDVRAYSALGVPAPGWPRHTGGWIVATPAVGDLDGDGRAEVAVATREGWLFVWRTPAER